MGPRSCKSIVQVRCFRCTYTAGWNGRGYRETCAWVLRANDSDKDGESSDGELHLGYFAEASRLLGEGKCSDVQQV